MISLHPPDSVEDTHWKVILLHPEHDVQIIRSETGSFRKVGVKTSSTSPNTNSVTVAATSKFHAESTSTAPKMLSSTSLMAFGGSCFHPLSTMSWKVIASRTGTYRLIAELRATLLISAVLCIPRRLMAMAASAGAHTQRDRAHDSWPEVACGNLSNRYFMTTRSMTARILLNH